MTIILVDVVPISPLVAQPHSSSDEASGHWPASQPVSSEDEKKSAPYFFWPWKDADGVWWRQVGSLAARLALTGAVMSTSRLRTWYLHLPLVQYLRLPRPI